MAFNPATATKASKPNLATGATYTDQTGNPFTGNTPTVNADGTFTPITTVKPQNDYTDPRKFATVPGPYDSMRDTLKAQNPGIPASFIDDEIDQLNSGRTHQSTTNYGTSLNPQEVGSIVRTEWQSEPDRTRYEQTDAGAVTQQKQTDLTQGGLRTQAANTAGATQASNNFWSGTVTPAIQGAQSAVGNQKTVDATQQGRVDSATQDYITTMNGTQAGRMADIGKTNDYLTGLAGDYNNFSNQTIASNAALGAQFVPTAQHYDALDQALTGNLANETQSTNAANLQLGQQLTQAANSTNANQTGLYNTLAGQASSINDNQTQLFNQLASQAASSNSALNSANSTFQGQLGALNDQQMAADTLYQQQLGEMNGLDRASLANYMNETNPLMSAMQAQGSDPADVARQQDVIQRYKDLSNPQVTDQERLVAELARRKFESDDQSNRDALMQQLRGRGLQSGGLVIAGLQSANQQTANDRQIAEMNLNASAQQRAMQGMAGYADSSDVLRNADDAMRNFQDQYAQNDAVRRGNLADQREGINLAETNQETGRYTSGFDATTTSLNNNTQRDSLGFDANRNTINDNYNRDASVFDAGTTTNNANYGRDQSVYNAGTQTNEDNFGRTNTAISGNWQINQGNLGNTQQMTTINSGINNTDATRDSGALQNSIGTNQTNLADKGTATGLLVNTAIGNSGRTQGGFDHADTVAKGALDATGAAATLATGIAASEAGTATNWAGQAGGLGTTFNTLSHGDAAAANDAIDKTLGQGEYTDAKKKAQQQT